MPVTRIEIVSLADGKKEFSDIEFTQTVPFTLIARSDSFGELSFVDDSIFSALCSYRRRLEEKGYLALCNGSRKDAYPSPMSLQMGGGRKAYLLHAGKPTERESLVDIFDEAPIDMVCGVEEQRVAYEMWISSLR